MSSKNEDILNAKDLALEFDEPENDDLAKEEELSDEELAAKLDAKRASDAEKVLAKDAAVNGR